MVFEEACGVTVGEGPMVAVDAPQGLEWLEVDRRNWYLRIEAAMD